jgi:hypothetical protein
MKILNKRAPHYSLEVTPATQTPWIKFSELSSEKGEKPILNINQFTYDLYNITGGSGIQIRLTSVSESEIDTFPETVPSKLWTAGNTIGTDDGDGVFNDSDYTTSEVTAFRVVSNGSSARLIIGGY